MVKKIPNKIDKIIQEFIIGVNKILGNRLKKVILYGSYARGDFNKHSDIDIMLLTNLSDKELIKYRNKIYDYAYDLECKNDFDIQLMPLVKNLDKFNYWLEVLPFYKNVQKEGVILSEQKNI